MDVDSKGIRSNLLPETTVVWMARSGPRGASTGGMKQHGGNTTFHLLQQWWRVPSFASAGLSTAPEKSLEDVMERLRRDEQHDQDRIDGETKTKTKTMQSVSGGGDGGGSSSGSVGNADTSDVAVKALPATPATRSMHKRGSMFAVLDTVFGYRGHEKANNARADLEAKSRRSTSNVPAVDLLDRLRPEQPLDPKSVRTYQQYVALGSNPWHNHGHRAERQLHQDHHNNGMPDKRALEMFRHVSYLHADPLDLEGMRDVQSAGGATKIITHGMYRGLSQDEVAVDTKSILDQFLWSWESGKSDREIFEKNVFAVNGEDHRFIV